MQIDAILERVLDRLDKVADSVAALNAKNDAIVARLDKINGSVQRHQEALTETKLWQAHREGVCKATAEQLVTISDNVADISKKRQPIKDKTILQAIAMLCGTALTIYGVQVSGFLEALTAFMR